MNNLYKCLLGLALAWTVAPALAVQHALLVGVSDYPALPKLKGPANDVRLMRDVLARLGVDPGRIRIVADGVPGATHPTRANILAALDQLVASTRAGDQVYLHFSGHGSQQLATAKALAREVEPDGLTEIFLPIDAAKVAGRKVVPEAIADYEFSAYLDRFLAKGAFVWAVFDTCHSASMMRGTEAGVPPEGAVSRHVRPQDLGLPSEVEMARIATRGDRSQAATTDVTPIARKGTAAKGRGGYVSFYASQPNQKTEEWPLPLLADAPARQSHGLLTWFLAEALQDFNGGSYEQLGQFIQQRYFANGVVGRITPAFWGDGLATSVFLPGQESGIRQWMVEMEPQHIRMGAGLLHQITEGSEFLLLPDGLADDAQALARAVAARVDALGTELRLLPDEKGHMPTLDRTRMGLVARQSRPKPGLTLLVAVDGPSAKETPDLAQAVDRLRKNPPPGLRLTWVASDRLADIKLYARHGRIWLVAPGTVLRHQGEQLSPFMDLAKDPEDTAAQLAGNLKKAARALNLVRVADSLKNQSAGGVKLDFQLEFQRGADEPRQLARLDDVREGDLLCWRADNRGTTPFDLTVLLVDAHFAINSLFPTAESGPNRLQKHGTVKQCADFKVQSPFGLDRMLVFAVPERIGAQATDLSFLTQESVHSANERGAPMSDLETLLVEAAFGEEAVRAATRGEPPRQAPALVRAAVKLVQWESQPPKQQGAPVKRKQPAPPLVKKQHR